MFTIINGAYIILKNESSRSLSELSVGPRPRDTLRLEVRCDVSSLLVVVSLIKQSEGIPRIYRPFEYGVVLSYLNLNEKVKLGYAPNNPLVDSNPLYSTKRLRGVDGTVLSQLQVTPSLWSGSPDKRLRGNLHRYPLTLLKEWGTERISCLKESFLKFHQFVQFVFVQQVT